MDWDDINVSIWDALSQRAASSPNLVAAEQITHNRTAQHHLYAFVSSDRSLHLLVAPEQPIQERLVDPKAAGLKLSLLPNHLVSGRPRQDYIDLKCTTTPHLKSFTELVWDVAKTILSDGVPPSRAINQVIRRWRSFWGRPGGVLTEGEQLGVLGELLVLEHCLVNSIGDPIRAWVGPNREVHDFLFPNLRIEVKSTTYLRHKHLINGVDQLDCSGTTLVLVSILATKGGQQGVSVADQVDRINVILGNRPDDYEEFNHRLSDTGFRYEHRASYQVFLVGNATVYPVGADFPGLTSRSFVTPPSTRVSSISYVMDLEGLRCYPLNQMLPRHI